MFEMADKEKASERGQNDAGKNCEDWDILGKRQEDLTSDDLKGDARYSKVE
jgi:hypothetical protein